ncbi:MAG: OsmC family peroxiredoxin [Verrucomicrobiota bacterium]
MTRRGSAEWKGDLKTGKGTTSTGSGSLKELPYSVPSRFESGGGTNPEELIAAAHASCFSMMLAKVLGDQGIGVRRIATQAALTLRLDASGAKLTQVHLATEVAGERLDEAGLKRAAEEAKEKCPVSVLLKPGLERLTLDVKLVSA